MIQKNLIAIKEQIQEKSKEPIQLIAVSKTVDVDKIEEAVLAGHFAFGENRVQELVRKHAYFDANKEIEWHLIGHLQTNKVKQVIDKVSLIHSLDRISLAEEIEKQASKIGKIIPCLIELNIGEEESKFGLKKEELENFLSEIAKYPHILVKGLMTVAPYSNNGEEVRWVFREMKEIFEKLKKRNEDKISMEILSMGMSNDFLIAIEEGATMVRVGTSIFGKRDYTK